MNKTLKSAHGHDVAVTATRAGDHAMHIVATVGASRYEMRATYGAMDGPAVAVPTTEQLQAIHDRDCQAAADHASWKEALRENLSKVK